jgi:hypothetical protein
VQCRWKRFAGLDEFGGPLQLVQRGVVLPGNIGGGAGLEVERTEPVRAGAHQVDRFAQYADVGIGAAHPRQFVQDDAATPGVGGSVAQGCGHAEVGGRTDWFRIERELRPVQAHRIRTLEVAAAVTEPQAGATRLEHTDRRG